MKSWLIRHFLTYYLTFIPEAPCGAEESLLKIGTEFEFLPRKWLALRIVISIVGGEECPDLTLSSDFWKMNGPGMSELGWVGLNYIDSRQLFAYVDLCWGKEVAERRLPKGWMCDSDSSSGLSWEWQWEWWVRAVLKPGFACPLPQTLFATWPWPIYLTKARISHQ